MRGFDIHGADLAVKAPHDYHTDHGYFILTLVTQDAHRFAN